LNGFVETVIEVDEDIGWPEPLTKLFAGDDLAGGFDQDRQKLKRLLRQPDPCSVSGQLRGPRVELEGILAIERNPSVLTRFRLLTLIR